MSDYALPPDLKDLLTKLHRYGLGKEGEKYCFWGQRYVPGDSLVWASYRWITGETHESLLSELDSIMSKVPKNVDTYKSTHFRDMLFEGIKSFRGGLARFLVTYSNVPTAESLLRVHLDHLDLILEKEGYALHTAPTEGTSPDVTSDDPVGRFG